MTTSKPHPPKFPVHPIRDDGTTRYAPMDYKPLVNGRYPDGPPAFNKTGRRTYVAFRGKEIRIPVIIELVLGNIGMILSGLLVPFGTSQAHVVCAVGFVTSVIILNAGCLAVYAYKWKTKKTIIIAVSVTILASLGSLVMLVAPILSLLRDKHVLSLVLQVGLIVVALGEMGVAAYITNKSVRIIVESDRRRKGMLRSISGEEAPLG